MSSLLSLVDEKDCRIHDYDRELLFYLTSDMIKTYERHSVALPLCRQCALTLNERVTRRTQKGYPPCLLDEIIPALLLTSIKLV